MLKKIIHTLSTNVIVFILGFVTNILIARGLGVEEKGIYAFVILIPTTLYSFLSLNYFAANIYFLRKKIYSGEELFYASLVFYLILSGVEVVGITIFHLFIHLDYYIFIITFVFIFNLNHLSSSFIMGFGKIETHNQLLLIKNVVLMCILGFFFFFWKEGFKVMWVLTAQILSWLVIEIIGLIIVCKNVDRSDIKYKDISIKKVIFSLIDLAKHSYISNLCNSLNYKADQWFIKIILTNAGLGIYSTATALSEKYWIISNSLSTVLYPEVAGRKDYSLVTKGIDKMIVIVNVFGVIAWVTSFFVLDQIITFLYGQEYIEVSTIIKILFPGIVLFSIVKIISGFFAGLGRPDLRVKSAIISTLVNIIANIYMVPKYGIKGAAITSVISYSLYSVSLLISYVKIRKNPALFIRKEV